MARKIFEIEKKWLDARWKKRIALNELLQVRVPLMS